MPTGERGRAGVGDAPVRLFEPAGRAPGPPRPARVGALSPAPPMSPSVCGGGRCDSDWLCAAASGFRVSCFSAAPLVAASAYDADVVHGVLSAFCPLDYVVCFCAVGLLADVVVERDVAERACVLSLCLGSAFGLCCDLLPLRGSCAACRHGVLVVVCCECAALSLCRAAVSCCCVVSVSRWWWCCGCGALLVGLVAVVVCGWWLSPCVTAGAGVGGWVGLCGRAPPCWCPPGLCGWGPASAVGRGTLVVLVGVALWLPPATGRSPRWDCLPPALLARMGR